MPLTAMHATAGVIDLSLTIRDDDLVQAATGMVPWSNLHRARPRPSLSCRECGHGLHAKVSAAGLRFFAHDAGALRCSLAGETLAHRLLKMELVSAVRTAGWHAELEVPGNGWRADVLATSPDGTKRMAWEAQLAPATSAELAERTAAMAAEGVTVCWVTDKDRPFIGHVPSIRIALDDDIAEGPEDVQPDLSGVIANAASDSAGAVSANSRAYVVVDGLGAFEHRRCEPRRLCPLHVGGRDRVYVDTCPGHGWWERPKMRLTLAQFVAHVLHGAVSQHAVFAERPLALARHRPGALLWTTRRHAQSEHDLRAATDAALAAARERLGGRAVRQRRVDAELARLIARHARHRALTAPALEVMRKETGNYVRVQDSSPRWALGLPIFVHEEPRAIIAPAPEEVQGEARERIAALVVFVASTAERDELRQVCAPGQRIDVLDIEVPVPAGRFSAGGVSASEAFRFLLRRGRLG